MWVGGGAAGGGGEAGRRQCADRSALPAPLPQQSAFPAVWLTRGAGVEGVVLNDIDLRQQLHKAAHTHAFALRVSPEAGRDGSGVSVGTHCRGQRPATAEGATCRSSIAHDEHAANGGVDHVQQQCQLHVLLPRNACEGERRLLPCRCQCCWCCCCCRRGPRAAAAGTLRLAGVLVGLASGASPRHQAGWEARGRCCSAESCCRAPSASLLLHVHANVQLG